MNLKREMIAVHGRLDKIEAAIAGLLLSPPPTNSHKTIAESGKKKVAKKKAKKKVADNTSVKTTSDQIAQAIAQVEM
jgi:hypothetical protein